MNKKKYSIEHELRCRSERIIWPLISTAAGLSKWMADDVSADGDVLTFTWGELWRHHEVRRAKVLKRIDFVSVRLRWEDEPNPDAYWELRIEKGDITDDFILVVTDYAPEDDKDTLEDIWAANFERLHRSTGI